MGSPDFYNIYCVYSVNNRWWTPSSPPFLPFSLSSSFSRWYVCIFSSTKKRNGYETTLTEIGYIERLCTPYQIHHCCSGYIETMYAHHTITSMEFFLSFRSKVFMCETVTQDGTWRDEAKIKAGRTNWSRLKYHQRYTKKNLILDFIINTLNASSSSPRQQLNN